MITETIGPVGAPPEWAEFLDGLPTVTGTLTIEGTPQSRDDTEGRTMRAELAEGKCQHAWRNYPHVTTRPASRTDETVSYRQHRCGRECGHRGQCACRYCGAVAG